MDREAWHAAVHRVAKSWTPLSDWTELNPCLKPFRGLPPGQGPPQTSISCFKSTLSSPAPPLLLHSHLDLFDLPSSLCQQTGSLHEDVPFCSEPPFSCVLCMSTLASLCPQLLHILIRTPRVANRNPVQTDLVFSCDWIQSLDHVKNNPFLCIP